MIAQGGYYFYSLKTGQWIDRGTCSLLPVPQLVIDRAHALADQAQMQGNLIFTDRDGNILPEINEEDEDWFQEQDDQDDVPLILNNDDDLSDELQDIEGVDDIINNDILLAHPIQEHHQPHN